MLDIRFVRENPELVKENIRKKYQDAKLPLVDEVIDLDAKNRAAITEASELRAQKNKLSKANGPLFGKMKKASEEEKAAIQAEIDANMAAVKANDERLAELEKLEAEYPPFLSDRMTAATSKLSASVTRWCRTMRFPIIPRSWNASTASTWMPPAEPPETASIISWETSPVCTPPCWPMPVTL